MQPVNRATKQWSVGQATGSSLVLEHLPRPWRAEGRYPAGLKRGWGGEGRVTQKELWMQEDKQGT